VNFNTIPGAASAEDFALDSEGYVWSVSNNGLFRAAYGEPAELIVPGVANGFTSGTAILPGGDIVFADVSTGAVIRVSPEGEASTVQGGLAYPNGLTVDQDGWVYVAEDNGERVVRFDPDDPVTEIVVETSGPNGLAFSTDFERLYIGSFDFGGAKEYEFSSDTLSTINNSVPNVDGIAADECGNVYITEFGAGTVHRIDPEQNVEVVADLPGGWIPNMEFGSGVGGWERDKLYVNSIGSDEIYELEVGVKGIAP
jgi:sugar lactone lactonase YvrE